MAHRRRAPDESRSCDNIDLSEWIEARSASKGYPASPCLRCGLQTIYLHDPTRFPMSLCNSSQNRRDFLKTTACASTAIAALSIPRFAHAGVDETLKYGLIGCGKRGSGAAVDAMNADPHARLVAIGDTFTDSAKNSLESIKRNAPNKDQVAVD